MDDTMQGIGKSELPFELAFGTYEDARAMIGHRTPRMTSEFEVNHPMIKIYCALVEDANPSYWDPEFARDHWGGVLSPPGMLMPWLFPIPWTPEGKPPHSVLAFSVPLPGDTLINVSTDTEFRKPVLEGDRLSVEDELVEVSPEKHTPLGVGHFITTVATFYNKADEVVALHTNVLFRYTAGRGE